MTTPLPTPIPEALGDELTAIVTAWSVLDTIDQTARARVLSWAADFYNIPLALPVHLESGQPGPASEDELVGLAARWAAEQVGQFEAREIEHEILEAQEWGSEVGMVDGTLAAVAKRLRIVGGVRGD